METLGVLILRLTLGLIFIAHGLRQYLGWFGGGSMEDVMRRLGLQPAKLWASLCGLQSGRRIHDRSRRVYVLGLRFDHNHDGRGHYDA